MKVLPLTVDIAQFLTPRLRAEDVEELTALRADGDVQAAVNEAIDREAINFSFCDDDGIPIAMGGFWNGPASWIMNSWLVSSDRLSEIGLSFSRAILDIHNQLQSGGAVRRIQTACILRSGNKVEMKARRFLKFLGYVNEGTMHSYGVNGQNYLIMARIRQ